jgi:uncharacterized protein YndB with AHSA1/START domain
MDSTTTAAELELKRVIAAPREDVYRAWTESDALSAWFGPNGVKTRITELDPRPGGRYRFEMVEDNTYIVVGHFREVVAPERLVFTWTWETGDYAGMETEVEVTLAEVAGGTELTLVHRRLPSDEAREKHGQGWGSSFDCLDDYLAGQG